MDHTPIRYAENYSDLPHYRAVSPNMNLGGWYRARSSLSSSNPATPSVYTYSSTGSLQASAEITPTYYPIPGLYAPPYDTTFRAIRFLGAGYADTDPDAVLGKWAMRSRWYLFEIRASAYVYSGYEPPEGNIQFHGSLYLLDQYFDYTAATWNNLPELTGAKVDFAYTMDVKSSGGDVSMYSMLWIEVPRLALDDRPVPIYGFMPTIDLDADPTGAGRISYSADLRGWHDDERVPYDWNIFRVQPYYAQTHYKGEFLPL